jgi:ribosome-interacting GTPase 1
MPINASPQFEKAQVEYLNAQTTEQKIRCLKKMIALAPKHKGAENLLKQLKTRLKKLKYTKEKESKSGKSTQKGIKKEDMQAVIIGKTNSGKSTLLSQLTNAHPTISEVKFSTVEPVVGMMSYAGTSIQLIEVPAPESEYYDKGLVNTADTILILVNTLEEIEEIRKRLEKSHGKQIIVFNKLIPFEENERKINATLASKKYNFEMISTNTKENYEELKNKIFESFDKIRVFTKEPGKEPTKRPIILEPGENVKKVAEKILKGFSKKVKETKIWGPSSKFPGQKVGLKHKLKDLDIVEFKTK